MQARALHILWILFAFALYTIPLCQCAEMMKAKAMASCCAASSAASECDDATNCCVDGSPQAEKMNAEKSFESAKVSLSAPSLLSFAKFPSFPTSSQSVVLKDIRSASSPPTQAFLQVFLI